MTNIYVAAPATTRIAARYRGWRWDTEIAPGIVLHAVRRKARALVDILSENHDLQLIRDASPTVTGAVRQAPAAVEDLAQQKMPDRCRVADAGDLERLWKAVQSDRFRAITGVKVRARLALFSGVGGEVLAAFPSSISTWRNARGHVVRFDLPCAARPEWPMDRPPLRARARWPDLDMWVREWTPLRVHRRRPESVWRMPAAPGNAGSVAAGRCNDGAQEHTHTS